MTEIEQPCPECAGIEDYTGNEEGLTWYPCMRCGRVLAVLPKIIHYFGEAIGFHATTISPATEQKKADDDEPDGSSD